MTEQVNVPSWASAHHLHLALTSVRPNSPSTGFKFAPEFLAIWLEMCFWKRLYWKEKECHLNMLLIFCRISETALNSELSDLQEQRFCDFLECKVNSKSICRNIELLSNSQVGLSPSDLTSAVSFSCFVSSARISLIYVTMSRFRSSSCNLFRLPLCCLISN